MIKLTVPATSANMGSGFDSAGIALKLYNYVQMEEWDGISIESLDEVNVPTGANNLIYSTAREVYNRCGRNFPGLRILQRTNIPMTRGLGSSTACLVAGILGANELLGNILSFQDMIDLAAEFEGHPDNTTPAFVGGYVNAVFENDRVFYNKSIPHKSLAFTVMIPPFPMATGFSRSVLPDKVSLEDAIYNLSRTSLLASAIPNGNIENIRVSLSDALHEPYRMELIENSAVVRELALSCGAYGVVISGAGSTFLVIHSSSESNFDKRLSELLVETDIDNWCVKTLECDEIGARIEKI